MPVTALQRYSTLQLLQLLQHSLQQRYSSVTDSLCPSVVPGGGCVTAALQQLRYSRVTVRYSKSDVAPRLWFSCFWAASPLLKHLRPTHELPLSGSQLHRDWRCRYDHPRATTSRVQACFTQTFSVHEPRNISYPTEYKLSDT